MEESTIRGLVIGAVFLLIAVVATGIWKIIRSPSEGARRIRWVMAGLGALLVLAILADAGGAPAVGVGLVVLGIAAWIYKGFQKSKP